MMLARLPSPPRLLHALLACALSFAAASPGVMAATSEAGPNEPAWMQTARKDLEAKRYDQAVTGLRTANATDRADWHNLLGYALRKKTPPDLGEAETHYKRALELDPKHRGALEYYGELMLMKNDLPGAEALLARLDKVCLFSCAEFRDLKAAVARYKADKTTPR